MRGRRTIAGALALTGLVLTACYPPSQNPTDQPLPPGGRVVATGPILTEMWIEDATDDVSVIVYGQSDFLLDFDPRPYRFWVVDDRTGTTTRVPVGLAEYGSASLSPDGSFVVFSSNDRFIQSGPATANCQYRRDMWAPPTATYCDELYLFDLESGATRQLTGLGGSSELDHTQPVVTADGSAVEFTTRDLDTPATYHRMDLETGEITDAIAPTRPTSWDRGSHVVEWDAVTGTLTSQDAATGTVTTLWEHEATYHLESAAGNGRYVVVSHWQTERLQVFRLIDTDTGTVRPIHSGWVADDGSRYAFVQLNVAPEAIDRLVIAPLPT